MDEEYVCSIFNNCSETCVGSFTCLMQHIAVLHVFHFLTRRNNVRFNCSFLQTSTGFQRQKKARKQQLYRFSQPCENQITQVVLKYLSFQCQIYEQRANTCTERNRVEMAEMDTSLGSLQNHVFLKKPGTVHLSVPEQCTVSLQTC